MKKNIFLLMILALSLLVFNSCEEDLDSESIFVDLPTDEQGRVGLDPNSYTYELDRWLWDNYLLPYNLQFKYRMEDVGADMNYNLIPTRYEKAIDMAVLTKYLWFDVYKDVIDPDFLKRYGPRIIHLIGSAAFNPNNGTKILGLAEGGIKVTLFQCNELDYSNIDYMNEQFFKTMHHEFAHILHQMKSYPKEFNLLSAAHYLPFNWEGRDFRIAASLGFVSAYGGSETREDFVEVIANYIVKTDAQWGTILTIASKNWIEDTDDDGNVITDAQGNPIYVEALDANGKPLDADGDSIDGVKGAEIIRAKLTICREWLKSSWGVDLDELRAEVQKRQANINIVELRNQITAGY